MAALVGLVGLVASLTACSGLLGVDFNDASATPTTPIDGGTPDGAGKADAGAGEASLLDGAAPDASGACTSTFGATLTGAYGRLDGVVVALVLPPQTDCPADATHIHVQVRSLDAVFDVAVPITFSNFANQIGYDAADGATLRGSPWAEGWHEGGAFDYVADVNVHSSSLPLFGPTVVQERLVAMLAPGDRVSVFGKPYATKTGLDAIFRDQGTTDGVIARVATGSVHYLLLRRPDQTF